MIKIEFTEESVFTFSKKNLFVGIWDHRDGRLEGPIIGCVGLIKFADKRQARHFMEMLEFMLEEEVG